MLKLTLRQAHEVISALWFSRELTYSRKIPFDFRNGGVTTQGTPPEMKAALKVFAATYCRDSFRGRLTFCLRPYSSGTVKVIVTPKDEKEYVLNVDPVLPHVYDYSGERIHGMEES